MTVVSPAIRSAIACHSAALPPNEGSMTTAGVPLPYTIASIRCRPTSIIVVTPVMPTYPIKPENNAAA